MERGERGRAAELLEPAAPEGADPKFNTADAEVTAIWDALQRRQVDFAIAQEVPAYRASVRWRGARTVLDVGTGNGYYLRRIATLFPGKAYRGIDTSKELIARAHSEEKGHACLEFVCRDVADEPDCHDFVIMRLLLQHLADPEAMLERAARVTAAGGAALVIDCWDAVRRFEPDLPAFRAFFRAYAEHQAAMGRRRDVVDRLPELARRTGAWRVADQQKVMITSSAPGQLARFREIYGRFIDMVERAGTLEHPFDVVRREWAWWCGLDGAYAQVGLNLVTLHRPA
jgi:SAM-dependent methyltransferase